MTTKDKYERDVALEGSYRNLYWELNELQIIATPACLIEAKKVEERMAICVAKLGYTPVA